MDQGADIIMPVAGPVGGGTLAALEDRGTGLMIGVDSDWAVTNPDRAKLVLTSVLKHMDATTFDVVKSVIDGTFTGGKFVGKLENKGVGLAPFHEFEDEISEELRAEVADLEAKLIAGEIDDDSDPESVARGLIARSPEAHSRQYYPDALRAR